jgi:hypothetical protein
MAATGVWALVMTSLVRHILAIAGLLHSLLGNGTAVKAPTREPRSVTLREWPHLCTDVRQSLFEFSFIGCIFTCILYCLGCLKSPNTI